MKRIGFSKCMTTILCILTAAMIFFGCAAHNNDVAEYRLIRIHIRADSNEADDQRVKLAVRDRITEYLESEIGEVQSAQEAYAALEDRLEKIESMAEKTLIEQGFDYGARARLDNEYFPTRAYADTVVDSGYYDALIIELGSGTGDNWWCVIYPPLCYVGAEKDDGFRYKSKIMEIWKRWFG